MAVPLYKYVLATTCLLYPRTDIIHDERRIPETQHAARPIQTSRVVCLAQCCYHVSWYLVHTVSSTATFSINTLKCCGIAQSTKWTTEEPSFDSRQGQEFFCSPNHPDRLNCSAVTGCSLPAGKRTGGKDKHLPLSSVEFENAWRYTPISHTPSRHEYFDMPSLTLRRLMSYIYMEHPFLMFLDHTQRRSTVGRTPLDE